jgi:mutator protein MutT
VNEAPGSIDVVAAVIRRGERYLVGRRPDDKRHGGLWEFPGGKVHDGEDLLATANRELDEELGMRAVTAGALLMRAADAGSPFVIHFVEIDTEGEPEAREHSEIGWFTPAEMRTLPLAPADARFVEMLRAESA